MSKFLEFFGNFFFHNRDIFVCRLHFWNHNFKNTNDKQTNFIDEGKF